MSGVLGLLLRAAGTVSRTIPGMGGFATLRVRKLGNLSGKVLRVEVRPTKGRCFYLNNQGISLTLSLSLRKENLIISGGGIMYIYIYILYTRYIGLSPMYICVYIYIYTYICLCLCLCGLSSLCYAAMLNLACSGMFVRCFGPLKHQSSSGVLAVQSTNRSIGVRKSSTTPPYWSIQLWVNAANPTVETFWIYLREAAAYLAILLPSNPWEETWKGSV